MKLQPTDNDIYIEKNFFKKEIPEESRESAMSDLFFNYKEHWKMSFWFMLILASGIATLGLSENASATVIGAMIVAPLGQPIVALGGTVALGWRNESVKMLGLILLGAATVILVGFLFGFILNEANPNDQILARTAPDVRDLGIAIFAGAAGAYGYFRSEYSSVLAGVAIAVALVPPLCACGMMLEAQHFILAKGALLLFFTNFIGIALAAITVFFFLGAKHTANTKWFYSGTIVVFSISLLILIPLSINYNLASSQSQNQTAIFEKASTILNDKKNVLIIKEVTITGTEVIITINDLPSDKITVKNLTKEIQKTTPLQVLLQNSND
ncbi:putative hydrophobic protein (TIGR00271 family) [Flavobacterium sp. 7E]|uniref:DUF389 domain-containing protein n=1 Tax=Flavobacterium sp. 7E TaxID=2735898 RepID=UPI00156F0BE0|nr:DUF389 domain-containing protein [Flavobacterium sp. 7E]NRS89898.1 putative hydrophobic protein (TIGR00271 family) [Flavobacterium sp. 7E]